MASLQGVEILIKYGREVSLLDIGDTLSKACDLLAELDTQIKDAGKSDSSVKSPYDTAAEKDKVAEKEAADKLHSIISDVAAWIDEKPSRAFHLGNGSKIFSQFVTEEVRYARRRSERDLPADKRSDSEAIKRSDAKVLIGFAGQLWNMAPALADEQKAGKLSANVKVKDGKLDLPRIRESASNGSVPTQGRYVKLYSLLWSVDGESFPIGTDPATILREIFTGASRVGAKIGDLWEPFDKQGVSQLKPGQSLEATINGHKVVATMVESEG